ncbi:MAG: hypothetical protein ABS81_08335 [Pseudonocardia sp. SCN 72-86]|nr:MAG: hypothetical protein ABS81_08335 [Pseudonocardia sp. SCN 72-86]
MGSAPTERQCPVQRVTPGVDQRGGPAGAVLLVAAAVALVEDQVDDGEDGVETFPQQVRGRHAERDGGGLDLAFRAHETLRHRGFGDEEGAGDLVGREPAEGA